MEVILTSLRDRLVAYDSLVILGIGAVAGAILIALIAAILGLMRGRSHRYALESETARANAMIAVRDEKLEEMGRHFGAAEQEIARLNQQVAMTEERLSEVKDLRESMQSSFRDLSSQTLQNSMDQFLKLANQRFEQLREGAKGDLEQRKQSINQLIQPLGESLKKMDAQVRAMEAQREGAYGALRQQITSLSESQEKLRSETGNLVQALRKAPVRGRWGELQLKRVVELAGMVEHCDFDQQAHVAGEAGPLRPDMIVRLPGGGQIVVDAKTPLDSYMAAMEAEGEEARRAAIAQHAARVGEHVKELSRKGYRDQFDPTPDFVVMFLPTESVFAAALDAQPGLIEAGARESVILATPTTLIALLRAVAYGWRQERLAQNARHIADTGRELYDRLAKLGQHTQDLGKHLGRSVNAYNGLVSNLESRVLVSARKMGEMGVPMGEKPIPTITPVEDTPREISKPELLAVGESDA